MTYIWSPPFQPAQHWNGPICPACGRGYIQPSTLTFITYPTYQPRHRKPGPAQ